MCVCCETIGVVAENKHADKIAQSQYLSCDTGCSFVCICVSRLIGSSRAILAFEARSSYFLIVTFKNRQNPESTYTANMVKAFIPNSPLHVL